MPCDLYLAKEFHDRLAVEEPTRSTGFGWVGEWQKEFRSSAFMSESWYIRGAEFLLKTQSGTESWDGRRVAKAPPWRSSS